MCLHYFIFFFPIAIFSLCPQIYPYYPRNGVFSNVSDWEYFCSNWNLLIPGSGNITFFAKGSDWYVGIFDTIDTKFFRYMVNGGASANTRFILKTNGTWGTATVNKNYVIPNINDYHVYSIKFDKYEKSIAVNEGNNQVYKYIDPYYAATNSTFISFSQFDSSVQIYQINVINMNCPIYPYYPKSYVIAGNKNWEFFCENWKFSMIDRGVLTFYAQGSQWLIGFFNYNNRKTENFTYAIKGGSIYGVYKNYLLWNKEINEISYNIVVKQWNKYTVIFEGNDKKIEVYCEKILIFTYIDENYVEDNIQFISFAKNSSEVIINNVISLSNDNFYLLENYYCSTREFCNGMIQCNYDNFNEGLKFTGVYFKHIFVIYLFAIWQDQTLWYLYYDGNQWTNWQTLFSGYIHQGVSAIIVENGNIEVFSVDINNTLIKGDFLYNSTSSDYTWSGMSNYTINSNISIISTPAVIYWYYISNPRVDILVISSNNTLFHTSDAGITWESLGDCQCISSPAITYWNNSRYDIFILGVDNSIWHKSSNYDHFSDWESLGGKFTSSPSVTVSNNSRIDIFVKGIELALWHKWWDGVVWSVWEKIEGSISSTPIALWSEGKLKVFAKGEEGGIWQISYNGNKSGWKDWKMIGGNIR